MARRLPPHRSLSNATIPLPNPTPELRIMLTYEPESVGSEHILFKFQITPVNHPPMPTGLPPLSFYIFKDCKITMTLDPNKKWRWSQQYYVIPAKDNYNGIYSDVNIDSDTQFHFFAKYNRNNVHHAKSVHKFNLNIDYEQGSDWLPITIDPDVGNPRPPDPLLIGAEDIEGIQESFFTVLTGSVKDE